MPRTKKSPKGSWVVTLVHTVKKELICEDCTFEEANENPFPHSISEREIDSQDYEVTHVETNN